MRLLGQRVEHQSRAQMGEGALRVRRRFGQPGEQRALRFAVVVAQGDDPILVEPGEQVAATQRERVLVVARRHQRRERRGVGPRVLEPRRLASGDDASPRPAARRPARHAGSCARSRRARPARSAPRARRVAVRPGIEREVARTVHGRAGRPAAPAPRGSSSPSTRTRSMARHYRAAITVGSRNDHGARGGCAP